MAELVAVANLSSFHPTLCLLLSFMCEALASAEDGRIEMGELIITKTISCRNDRRKALPSPKHYVRDQMQGALAMALVVISGNVSMVKPVVRHV